MEGRTKALVAIALIGLFIVVSYRLVWRYGADLPTVKPPIPVENPTRPSFVLAETPTPTPSPTATALP